MSNSKIIMYPCRITILYLLGTLFLFFLGPIKWIIPSPVIFILVNTIYILSFYLGYKLQASKKKYDLTYTSCNLREYDDLKFNANTVFPLLIISCSFMIVRDLINYIHYFRGEGIMDLIFQAFSQTLGESYFSRLGSSLTGTWYIFLLNLFNVLGVFWFPLGVIFFKKLPVSMRILLIITFTVDMSYSLLGGAMIGIGIYIFRLMPIFIFFRIRSKARSDVQNHKKKRIDRIVVCLAIVFLLFFSYAQESRYKTMGYDGVTYETGNLRMFISEEEDWPVGGTLIKSVQFYITHGYVGMAYAMKIPAKWTYGIGFSRDLDRTLSQYTGYSVANDIYPARLDHVTRWTNGLYWPTAYTWFASDWTFWGIPILMYLFGIFFAKVWKAVLYEKTVIPYVLFGWLWIGIFFIPCNNQLFQSFEMFMGTVSLMILFQFRKSLPRMVLKTSKGKSKI